MAGSLGIGRRWLAPVLAAAVAVAGLAACSPRGEGEGDSARRPQPTGNMLRRGTSDEPRTLDPHFVPGNAGAAIMYDMFEGLLAIDASGLLRPGLAETYTMSPDGLVYTFKLRENLKWSDGQPLVADDVVFSFRRSADPKTAARSGRVLFPLKNFPAIVRGDMPVERLGVTAPDPRTVVIEVDQPTAYLPDILASFSAGVVPRHKIEAFGDRWTNPENIAVSGAYTLEEWVGNTHIKLKKNPNHYDAANIKIDQVMFFPIERPQTALTRFRGGELDVAFGVPPDQIDWLEANYGKELRSAPVSGVFYALLNNRVAPTNDVRVRKALSISVDREQISATLLRNEAEPAYGIVPNAMPGHEPNPMPFAKQPIAARVEEAKALLAEAGYGPNNPLKITYKFGGQESNRRIAVALQQMWQALGAEVTLENVGANAVVADARTGSYQAMRYTYYAPYPDPVAFLKLFESGANTNFSFYADPAYDQMLQRADRIIDKAERTQALREVENKIMAQFPVIPIYFHFRYYLVGQRVQGWVENPRGEHLTRYLSLGGADD
jgi:oligopeptide transport system substrate-binding protein